MPAKYHIETKNTPPRFYPVGRYSTVEFREDCAGSCKECAGNLYREFTSSPFILPPPGYPFQSNIGWFTIRNLPAIVESRNDPLVVG